MTCASAAARRLFSAGGGIIGVTALTIFCDGMTEINIDEANKSSVHSRICSLGHRFPNLAQARFHETPREISDPSCNNF